MLPPRYSAGGLILAYAPLFAGPIVAGWAGHPMAMAWPFALIFLALMTWLRRPDLGTGAGWAQLGLLAVVQVALVQALMGFGRLLSVVRAFPDLPTWLPLAVSGAAAVLAMQRYRNADAMDRMLDGMIETVEAMETPERPAPVARFLRDVQALPARTTGLVDPIAQRLEAEMGPGAIPHLLHEIGTDPDVDFAVMRLLAPGYMRSDPGHAVGVSRLLECGLASRDPGVRGEAVLTTLAMIDAGDDPAFWPDPALVDSLAAEDPRLEDLARAMDAASA
ncbi:hypothetical protein [Mesobacterium pallidum]|uniref:hypothetical protein n=1 Tax=Mesobacterium pallidum TaxID=2872037 RepID=UPI001EE2A401|nr:hypothetical protein [Mesobacterium pallidum]